MADENLGSAYMDILLNMSQVDRDMKRMLRRLDRSISGADLTLEVDNRSGMAEVDQLIRRVEEAARNGETIDIKVDANTSEATIRELQTRLAGIRDADVNLTANTRGREDINQMIRQLNQVDGITASARVIVDASGAEREIRNLRDEINRTGSEAKGLGSQITGLLTGAAAAVGGKNLAENALNLRKHIETVKRTVGKGVDATELERSIKDSFNQIGGDVEASDIAKVVAQQFKIFQDPAVARKVSKTLTDLQQVTGHDLNELATAFQGFSTSFKNEDPAKVLESFSYAILNTPDMKGELLDSLAEYSAKIREAGFNSAQAAKLIEANGTAFYSLDKALDAMKERYLSASDSADAFYKLNQGLGNKSLIDLSAALQNGSITLSEYRKKLDELKTTGKVTADQYSQIVKTIENAGSGDFAAQVEDGIKDLTPLRQYKKALNDIAASGKISQESLQQMGGTLDELSSGASTVDDLKKNLLSSRNAGKISQQQFETLMGVVDDTGKKFQKMSDDGVKLTDDLVALNGTFANADVQNLAEQLKKGNIDITQYSKGMINLYKTGKITKDELAKLFYDIAKGPGEDIGIDNLIKQIEIEVQVKADPNPDLGNALKQVEEAVQASVDPLRMLNQRINEFISGDLYDFLIKIQPQLIQLIDLFAGLLQVVGSFINEHPQIAFWTAALLTFGGAITAVAAAFGALRGLIAFAFAGIGPIFTGLGPLFTRFGTFLSGAGLGIAGIRTALTAFLGVGTKFIPFVGWILLIIDLVSIIGKWFGVDLPNSFDVLLMVGKQVLESLTNILYGPFLPIKLIYDAVRKISSLFGVEMPSFLEVLKTAFANTFGTIVGWVKEGLNWVEKLLTSLGIMNGQKSIEFQAQTNINPRNGNFNNQQPAGYGPAVAVQNQNVYYPSDANQVNRQLATNFGGGYG